MRYAACVEYDGSNYSGWQTQKHDVKTVQASIESALSKVADESVAVITAGRTDAGVHATHQVIHFDSDAGRSSYSWCRGSNRFLDRDIRLRWVQPVDPEFHARFSAVSRSYRYILYNDQINHAILRNYVSCEFTPLTVERMRAAGELLLGEHDFSSFRAAGCQAHSPVRTVSHFDINSQGPWLWFDITANAFLQHMVRNIAGALIEVGTDKRDLAWIEAVLKARDRTTAGITAPANGLYLVGVEYPDEFNIASSRREIAYWGN